MRSRQGQASDISVRASGIQWEQDHSTFLGPYAEADTFHSAGDTEQSKAWG